MATDLNHAQASERSDTTLGQYFQLYPENFVSFLAYRPVHLFSSIIPAFHSSLRPPTAVVKHRRSLLGNLDVLPPDIIVLILIQLDYQSVGLFARVSFRGYTLVNSLVEHRDLKSYASQALKALRAVGLESLHSVARLHNAFITQECTKCAHYGAFLFLPTSERGCLDCLSRNPYFQMLSPGQAARIYDLRAEEMVDLPRLRGTYPTACLYQPMVNLVSATMARDLSLKIHGSVAALKQIMKRRYGGHYLCYASTYLFQDETLLIPEKVTCPVCDQQLGMAVVPFPSRSKLGQSQAEHGLWCRGCDPEALKCYGPKFYTLQEEYSTTPSGMLQPGSIFQGDKARAWSKESFLEHIKTCQGAQTLVDALTVMSERGVSRYVGKQHQ